MKRIRGLSLLALLSLLQHCLQTCWVGNPQRFPATSRIGHHLRHIGRAAGDEDAAERIERISKDWKVQELFRGSREAQRSVYNAVQAVGLTISLAVVLLFAVPALFEKSHTIAVAASQTAQLAEPPDRKYFSITGFPFPLGPFFERNTVEVELVKDRVYSFEQPQDLAGITANVRCTVFRTRDNHLVVYNPLAPTEEFLQQLKALNHKGVAHVLLGSTAYEHKVYTPAFSRAFPEAKVWAVPNQWSWPVDLPPPLLGLNVTGELLDTAGKATYANASDLTDEFEVKLLCPEQRLGFGYSAVEAAVFHKDTKVVALTDALLHIPDKATSIYNKTDLLAVGDKRSNSNSVGNLVLKAAGAVNWQGTAAKTIDRFYSDVDASGPGSESEQLQRGWELNTLLSLYFGPSPSAFVNPHQSFQKLQGKWIVAPVTSSLIYSSDRVKPELKRWVDDVAKWDFQMISPSHFEAFPGTPADLRAAFATTLESDDMDPTFDAADFNLLSNIKSVLRFLNVI